MDKNMKNLLETKFSPEEVKKYKSTQAFVYALIANNVFESQTDINLFLLEGIQAVYQADDEFPIHVYEKEESMNEAHRVVENIGEMLTDDFINRMKS